MSTGMRSKQCPSCTPALPKRQTAGTQDDGEDRGVRGRKGFSPSRSPIAFEGPEVSRVDQQSQRGAYSRIGVPIIHSLRD